MPLLVAEVGFERARWSSFGGVRSNGLAVMVQRPHAFLHLFVSGLANSASLGELGQRLAFLEDVGRKLGAALPIFRAAWTTPSRHKQHVALLHHRPLALELIFERALDDVDDLLARMLVPGKDDPGAKSTRA